MIPVNQPLLDGNEKKYLLECIDSGWISSEGPFVTRFEEQFASSVGRRHAVAVCNGTAAIDAVIDALRLGPGDEVILPTFTIISCVNQIARCGARAVVVDSDPLTWNMDVTQIESKITARTRAIMVVHIYGLAVDMEPVLRLAAKHGLRVIEDAAEVHGQTWRGRPCGSFGDVSVFSFYPNKHITTGEGGMIVTDDDVLANDCRSLRNLCFKPERRFVHDRLGWNLRMTNLQAALGLAQLEQLDRTVSRKRRLGKRYSEMLQSLRGAQLPLARTSDCENIYWVYGLVLDESTGLDAQQAISALGQRGVGCRPFFYPIHQQPVLRRMGWFEGESHPVAERLARQGFYIPSGNGLTDEQQEEVVTHVKALLA